MPNERASLGKLIAIHGTSPHFLQGAAIVAALSFLFFLATLFAFYLRQNFLYFLLASAFLIVYVFTMIGWWMQKRNVVSVYVNGLIYRKHIVKWSDITTVEDSDDGNLIINGPEVGIVTLPKSIQDIGRLSSFVRQHLH